MKQNIEIAVKNEIFSGFKIKLSMVVLYYLLPLLLTYHYILANVTVQAYNVTLQLMGKKISIRKIYDIWLKRNSYI